MDLLVTLLIVLIALLMLAIPILLILSVNFFIVFVGSLLILYRHKIRKSALQKLAEEFNLKFTPNPPRLRHFIFMDMWPYALNADWKSNRLEGIINNNTILIYDNLFSGPRVLWKPLYANMSHTVIKIDKEYLKGKESKYIRFKLGDAYLTPVQTLKKILKNISEEKQCGL